MFCFELVFSVVFKLGVLIMGVSSLLGLTLLLVICIYVYARLALFNIM